MFRQFYHLEHALRIIELFVWVVAVVEHRHQEDRGLLGNQVDPQDLEDLEDRLFQWDLADQVVLEEIKLKIKK